MNYYRSNQRCAPTLSRGTRRAVRRALERVLGSGVDVQRCLAAQALGHMADAGAVPALVAALRDEDEDVRSDAAAALAGIGDERAGAPLLENLIGDPCTDVKRAAVDGLGRMGVPAAVPWLRRLARGRDAEIFADDGEFFETGWDGYVDVQTAAIDGLATMGAGEAVPDIVGAIDDEFAQDLTATGFAALARLGGAGTEALAGYLDHADGRRRRRAVAVLAGLDSAVARDAVARALADPSADVRLAALRGLAAHRPGDAGVAAMFADPDAGVRAEAVRLCGAGHAEAVFAALDDPAPSVQIAALGVFTAHPGALSATRLAPRLRTMLGEASVAAAALESFAAVLGASAVEELRARLFDGASTVEARRAAVRGLAGVGDGTAARVLVAVVGDDDRQIRLDALAALARLAAADAWPNLPGDAVLAALRGELVAAPEEADAAPPVAAPMPAPAPAVAATTTLDEIMTPPVPAPSTVEAVELDQEDQAYIAMAAATRGKKLVPLTPNVAPHQDVRRFAARVLGEVGHANVALALAASLADGDAEVCHGAAESLARLAQLPDGLPDAARHGLAEWSGAGDRDMRLACVRALGAAGGAPEALARRLDDTDSFVRTAAVEALGASGVGGDAQALIDDADASVRLAAASAVADAAGEAAAGALFDFAFAFGGAHRRDAARLLRRVDADGACRRFVAVLADDGRRRHWQVALEALDELNRRTDPAEPKEDRDEG